MTRRAAQTAAGLIAFGAPLAVYLATLAREVTATDSGELAAVAATLGIAHPPGYPLFTLIGWLLAQLPVGTVAFRVGLASALAAAGTTLLIWRVGLEIGVTVAAARRLDAEGIPNSKPAQAADRGRPRPPNGAAIAPFAALAAALLFAWSSTVWAQAVVVEVYALQGLLVALVLAACRRALEPGTNLGRAWPLAGVAAGLAVTNHLTGVLLLPALLITVVAGLPRSRPRTVPLLARTAIAAALPLLLYLYLPLRSLASPPVRWTTTDSLQTFLVHVTGRQFQGLWGSRGLRLEELSRFAGGQLLAEATLLLPVLAVLGLGVMTRRHPGFALVSGLVVLLTVVWNIGYPIHDIAAFYLPVVTVLGLWAVTGAVAVAGTASRLHRPAGALVAIVLSATSLVPLARHWSTNDRHDFSLIACAVRDTLQPLAPNAVLFTSRWDTMSSPALYYQHVAGLRPDVLVLDYGRLSHPLLGQVLDRIAPDLASLCLAELAAAREIGERAERGQSYDVAEGRRHLEALRRALMVASVQRRPTYVTSDLYRNPMVAGFALSPEGLVARVAEQDSFHALPLASFQGPCGRRDELRGPHELLIWDDYRIAMINRASYLRRHGRQNEAVAYDRRAAALTVTTAPVE